MPKSSRGSASASSFGSSASGRSLLSRLEKYDLKKKFYEKVEDFEHKVLLHREPGLVVYRARCSYSGAVVGLKGYARESLTLETRRRVWNEVQTHQNSNCPFILKCFDAFEDQGRWWLVMENAALGDLYGITKDYGAIGSEGWVVTQVLLPLLQTVAYLHKEGIIHRDIKPENIYFNIEKVAKLSGFFLAVDVTRFGLPNDMVGSLDYVSPEVFLLTRNADLPGSLKHYDYKVDIWQVGVLMYDLLAGQPPFNSVDAESTANNILTSDPEWLPWMSDECIDFISQALDKNPSNRPDARQLLNHPWVRFNMGWKPPDDFEDPIPDLDMTYYEEDAEDEGNSAPQWYNPMSWFRKDPEHDDLRDPDEQDLRGTAVESKGFNLANLFSKLRNQPSNNDNDEAFFKEKQQHHASPSPPVAPNRSAYPGAGALPVVGGELHKYTGGPPAKYTGGPPAKGASRRSGGTGMNGQASKDMAGESPERCSHQIIKVDPSEEGETRGSLSRFGPNDSAKSPLISPVLMSPKLTSAKAAPSGGSGSKGEQGEADARRPKAGSNLQNSGEVGDLSDDDEDPGPTAFKRAPFNQIRSASGLGGALDELMAIRMSTSGKPDAPTTAAAAATWQSKPPPLPLDKLPPRGGSADAMLSGSGRMQADAANGGRPGIGSFRAGKDSPFSSPRLDPTPPGGTPRSARSNLAMQGVQEPPIPGSPRINK